MLSKMRSHFFSTQLGSHFWIPKTNLYVQCFPGKIIVFDIAKRCFLYEILIQVNGPVLNFFVCYCFFSGNVSISFKDKNAKFSFKLFSLDEQTLCFSVLKSDAVVSVFGNSFSLRNSEVISIDHLKCNVSIKEDVVLESIPSKTFLTFGSHKKKDMVSVFKRNDPKQILPFLYEAASFVPNGIFGDIEDDVFLFEKNFRYLASTQFDQFGIPSCIDIYNQGVSLIPNKSPLEIVKSANICLTKSLINVTKQSIFFFSRIPHWGTSGQLVNFYLKHCCINVRWRGRRPFSISIKTSNDIFKFNLELPKYVKSFRFRSKDSFFTQIYTNKLPFSLSKNSCYFIDRFEF